MKPFARGDFVILTIGTWTQQGMVALASPNGRSLVVLFDGAAPLGGGYALGMLALLQEVEGGAYVDLITHTAVEIAQVP